MVRFCGGSIVGALMLLVLPDGGLVTGATGATVRAPVFPDAGPILPIASERRIIGYGSGFFINRSGNFVTGHHVIAECTGIAVLGDGIVLDAVLVAAERGDDLAILRTEKTPGRHALLKTESANVLGKSVFALGYPRPNRHRPITVTEGFVSADSKRLYSLYELQTLSPIRDGNSGGPVLDAEGTVVGIISAQRIVFRNIALIIKIKHLVQLLDRAGISFDRALGASSAPVGAIAERARAYTYPVVCYGRPSRRN